MRSSIWFLGLRIWWISCYTLTLRTYIGCSKYWGSKCEGLLCSKCVFFFKFFLVLSICRSLYIYICWSGIVLKIDPPEFIILSLDGLQFFLFHPFHLHAICFEALSAMRTPCGGTTIDEVWNPFRSSASFNQNNMTRSGDFLQNIEFHQPSTQANEGRPYCNGPNPPEFPVWDVLTNRYTPFLLFLRAGLCHEIGSLRDLHIRERSQHFGGMTRPAEGQCVSLLSITGVHVPHLRAFRSEIASETGWRVFPVGACCRCAPISHQFSSNRFFVATFASTVANCVHRTEAEKDNYGCFIVMNMMKTLQLLLVRTGSPVAPFLTHFFSMFLPGQFLCPRRACKIVDAEKFAQKLCGFKDACMFGRGDALTGFLDLCRSWPASGIMSWYPVDRKKTDIAWALFDFDHGKNSVQHVIFSRLITMISLCNMTLAWCTPIFTMSSWHANKFIVGACGHVAFENIWGGFVPFVNLDVQRILYLFDPIWYSCRRVPDEDVWRRCVFQRGNLQRKTHAQNIPIYINI